MTEVNLRIQGSLVVLLSSLATEGLVEKRVATDATRLAHVIVAGGVGHSDIDSEQQFGLVPPPSASHPRTFVPQ